MKRTTGIKLTEEDLGYFDLLHRRLTIDEQFLQWLRCFKPAVHHTYVFKRHWEWRVHEGRDQRGSVGFDPRQRQLAAKPGGDCGCSVGYRGLSHREIFELEVVQFGEHADEVQERVGVNCHTLDAQRGKAFGEVTERVR